MSPSIATESLDAYNASLATTVDDKLWFAGRAQANLWVDFGCADGAVLQALRLRQPCIALGFDVDQRQCIRAEHRGIAATTDWSLVEQSVRRARQIGLKVGLHASSVLDEVPDLAATVRDIKALKPDVIVLRQHAVSDARGLEAAPQQWVNAILRGTSDEDLMAWLDRYGPLATRKDILHFLLKAPYLGTPDYARELTSDYLTLASEDWLELFRDEYRVAYSRHDKGNGFIQMVAYTRFGLYVPDNTHVKIIFERR